jgi:hypothetical protein
MPKSATAKGAMLNNESLLAGLSRITAAVQLVNSQEALDSAAREIIEIARRARVSREMELCNRASSAVLALPASGSLRSVAEFYAGHQEYVDQTRAQMETEKKRRNQ